MFPVLSANTLSTGYNLNNSLRFRLSASAYLNRTPASAGNRKTFTWSAWVKRGALNGGGTDMCLFNAGTTSPTYDGFRIKSDTISFFQAGAASVNIESTQVFRDPSAWYHLVLAVDTTQATAANRVKIYVNGSQITAFGTANYPALNAEASINNNLVHNIAAQYANTSSSSFFDGYMTEINFIDGQALTPSSFGSTNSTTGVWQPAKYTGTYGTNGFYLPFSDIGQTVSSNVGLGKDFSGNSNYWVTNNISTTAGTTYDAMIDSPTLTSATVANYAVMNPVGVIRTTSGALATFAGGNLNVSGGANWFYAYSSIAIPIGSGKYYAEFTINTSGGSDYIAVGINPVVGSFGATAHSSSEGGVWYSNNATKWLGSTNSSYGASYTAGDVIGVAVDSGASTITFYKNNTSQGSISFNSNLTSNTFALLGVDMYNSSISANFGQRPFSYTPPTNFVALNTFNLPDSTIKKGNSYMNAVTYTGSASNVTVTSGFYPDLTWAKSRNNTYNNSLIDSNRGGNAVLFSNLTNAESTVSGLATFSSTGVTYLAGASGVNADASTNYVLWAWNAGAGSTSSNTSGTITSTVSVNATAGFSIVTYTGTGANATVGHGLGIAPKMIIVKNKGSAVAWAVWHTSIANTQYLVLNTTAVATTGATWWNSTSPTLSVFSVGTSTSTNASTNTYVAYCWAEIAGFSKFGSYTGNGSTDGIFVYLGFRPEFLMIKTTSQVNEWIIVDSARATSNVIGNYLLASTSAAEDSGYTLVDFVSNGFKMRNSFGGWNGSSENIIYMAFAENPFKNANAR
jgi:hypothetical protein